MKSQGLSEKERIKSKKEFEIVYSAGKTIISPNRTLKAVMYSYENFDEPSVKVGFAVHKKAGKAFWRNRIKRLLRTAYRLNKKLITEIAVSKQKTVLVVFSLVKINQRNYNKIKLDDLQPDVIDLIKLIKNII